MNAPDLMLPPHSVEAEQSVIGGLILDSRAWDRVADIVTEGDFYRDDHRRIFAHIRKLCEQAKPVDILTVSESIQRSNEIEQVGGIGYLGDIANAVPSAANIRRYAEIVADNSLRRKLILAAGSIESFAHAVGPATDAVEAAQNALIPLMDVGGSSDPKHISEVLGRTIDEVQRRFEADVDVFGIPTGFCDLDKKLGGMQAGDLIILAGRPSMGKAQPLTSRVLLRDGRWKPIGSLMFGEHLASVDGMESRVIGTYPQGVKKIYRVTLSDGRSARCCAEHLWRVDSSRWVGGARVLETKELMRLLGTERYRNRITMPMVSGDFGVDDGLRLDPWLLGVLLGNGDCGEHQVRVSTQDAATLFRVQQIVGIERVVMCGPYDYRINRCGDVDSVLSELRRLGLAGLRSHEKFIPDEYMRAPKSSRLELLRGLLDTDGWVETFGAVRIALSNKRLAEQVRSLVWSVGGKCSISVKEPRFTHAGEVRDGLPSYVLNVQHANRASLMKLARKQGRCKEGARFSPPTIVSIDPDGEEEAVCIRVSHPSSLYVTDNYIVTHNTAIALNIAEHVATSERKPTVVFSVEMSDVQLAMRSIASLGSVPASQVRSGKVGDEGWDCITTALSKLHDAPLWIDSSVGLTAGQMLARCRRVARRHGQLALVVIDYLQLLRGEGNNRNEELGDITRRLKLMAKDLGCPVIALSQLSRKVEERTNHRPLMSDLRESGSIEQDADVILMMYRDEYYNPDSPYKGLAEVIIVKNRMGETGMVPLVFQGEYSRFKDADQSAISDANRRAGEMKVTRKIRRGFE